MKLQNILAASVAASVVTAGVIPSDDKRPCHKQAKHADKALQADLEEDHKKKHSPQDSHKEHPPHDPHHGPKKEHSPHEQKKDHPPHGPHHGPKDDHPKKDHPPHDPHHGPKDDHPPHGPHKDHPPHGPHKDHPPHGPHHGPHKDHPHPPHKDHPHPPHKDHPRPPHKDHPPHGPHHGPHKDHHKGDSAMEIPDWPKVASVVPHKYIVVFKQGVEPEAITSFLNEVNVAHARTIKEMPEDHEFFALADAEGLPRGGIKDLFNINDLFQGLIGYFPEQVVDLLANNDLVDFVERDSVVHASSVDTQNNAPWGLARISHRERLNLGNFNKYLYDNEGGKGVTSYVIDTGVNVNHVEFDGRAKWGKTIPLNDIDIDGNGHGTHCAGTIASKHYGIAKKANVVAVKVLKSDGSGTMSDVIKGVEYAAQSHLKEAKENKKFKGSTANMSLGGGKSPALDLAVDAAVTAGIHFAVAAGNENQDACNTSPASSEKAITVGASTLSDDRAYFSNWGKCVDIFAPGLNILSTYTGDSNRETATLSGTSMASPHVAGLLTYFLSLQPDSDSEFYDASKHPVTPAQLKKKLIAFSTKDVLSDLPDPDSPNLLIYNGGGDDLSSFWNASVTEEEHESSRGQLGLDNLEDIVSGQLGSTDFFFEQVRNLLDKMNIF